MGGVEKLDSSIRQGAADTIIGKQRNGPTGTTRLNFQSQTTRFENLAEDRTE